MKLRFLPDSVLASLKRSISVNLRRYGERKDPWLEEYLAGTNLPDIAESGIEVTGWPSLIDSNGAPVSDADAAQRLHESLRHLTPVQAGDERLWVCLCHVEPFYEYVRARWLTEGDEQKETAVVRRFFFENRGLGGISRNALARLWWCGHLTCEEGADDPYRYTKMLMQYADTPVGLLERCLGKSPEIVKQISRYISDHANGWQDRSHAIQKLIRRVNAAGGALVLDALPGTSIYDVCRRCQP